MKVHFSIWVLLLASVFVLSAQSSKPIARVNGAVLTDRDLVREMYTIFPYARVHNGFPKPMEADIRNGALKMIVFEELVYQEAERRKMTIPAAKLDRAVAEFHKQFSTEQEFQQYLKTDLNGSQDLLRAKVQRSLLIEEMLKIEVADRALVSLAEAKAYYDKNAERFRIAESFAVQTITTLPPRSATPAQLKETAARAGIALRLAKLTKNYTDFGLVAEKVSDDDYRVNMGDHHAVEKSKLPAPVVQALQGMHDGEVSDLIQVDQAYTIVRLNSHIAAGMKPFAEVKDALRKQLEKDKTEELRSGLDKRLRAKSKVEEL